MSAHFASTGAYNLNQLSLRPGNPNAIVYLSRCLMKTRRSLHFILFGLFLFLFFSFALSFSFRTLSPLVSFTNINVLHCTYTVCSDTFLDLFKSF